MVKNVRWLYNKLGTADISSTGSNTISGGINAVQNNIDGKANASHTHGVGDLPVSNSSMNSTSYVPSSSVVYSLKSTIGDLSAEVDDLKDQASAIPNSRYDSNTSYPLSDWSSVSDVDAFFNRFNHDNFYSDGDIDLAVGHTIVIRDGSYDIVWQIAGFDMEHNQTAADDTTYDNGYGICLIPFAYLTDYRWSYNADTSGGYISSTLHAQLFPNNLAPRFRNILGDHLITRNVLLSSSVDSSYHSNAYTWTNAEFTLMSVGQYKGTFASYYNKYDDGEANYKLPLYNFTTNINSGTMCWSRGIRNSLFVYGVDGGSATIDKSLKLKPMIYIR